MKIEIAAAQIKPRKGDYCHNLGRIGELFEQLEESGRPADVLVLPETVLSGYFLEGGVRESARSATQVFDDLQALYRSRVTRTGAALDICLGFYELGAGKLYNSALYATLSATGEGAGIRHVHRKFFLPTYGVFDEKRFVSRGRSIEAFDSRFGRVAVVICEDVWHSITSTLAALQGAQIIYVISASPGREFNSQHAGNVARWNTLLPGIADEHNVWVVYSGLVGFEGGKGFTGSSRVIDPWGNTLVIGPVLDECLIRATANLEDVAAARAGTPLLADLESGLADLVAQFQEVADASRRYVGDPRPGGPV